MHLIDGVLNRCEHCFVSYLLVVLMARTYPRRGVDICPVCFRVCCHHYFTFIETSTDIPGLNTGSDVLSDAGS